jgi:hypothetical protein
MAGRMNAATAGRLVIAPAPLHQAAFAIHVPCSFSFTTSALRASSQSACETILGLLIALSSALVFRIVTVTPTHAA